MHDATPCGERKFGAVSGNDCIGATYLPSDSEQRLLNAMATLSAERDTLRAEVAALKTLYEEACSASYGYAALKPDAERYRWLRDNDFTDIYCDHITSVLNGDTEATPLFEMRLDAALADKPQFTDGHGNDISHLVDP